MAVTTNFTSPGVYITETTVVPHIVTPATTSLTAVIGLFEKGPVDEAVLVTSWDDFAEQFGTFGVDSLAPYAVFQFFQNGGNGAWIVRLETPWTKPVGAQAAVGDTAAVKAVPAKPTTVPATVTVSDTSIVSGGTLTFTAQSPGTWANNYHVAIVPAAVPPVSGTAFDLTVTDATGDLLERIPSLPGGDLGAAATAISAASGTITASVKPTKSTTKVTLTKAPVAGTPATGGHAKVAGTPAPFPLASGADGTWTPATFVDQVLAELGFAISGPVPTPRLDKIAPQVFNLMVIPDAVGLQFDDLALLMGTAQEYCAARQAFLIMDTPAPVASAVPTWIPATPAVPTIGPLGNNVTNIKTLLAQPWSTSFLVPANANVAAYYPWIEITDPSTLGPKLVPPSGTIAGVYATTDATRGVWKAPAGVTAGLRNVNALADITINDRLGGQLNVAGINVLRTFATYGNVVWGARTLASSSGATLFTYLSVRRLADFIEQSLQQSLKWAVFEPNGPGLWAALKLEATAFMSGLYGAGAFSGPSASAAFQVACDATTTSPDDMLEGIVNLNVGFAAVDPAEFVVVNVTLNAATGTN
jgi:phage tail sheath protein FI